MDPLAPVRLGAPDFGGGPAGARRGPGSQSIRLVTEVFFVSREAQHMVGKGALKVVLSGIVVPVESPVLNSRTHLCDLLSRSADESRKY